MKKICCMTYNIHRGIGRDNTFDTKRIADIISNNNVDFAALQEVDNGHFEHHSKDQLISIAKNCNMDYIASPGIVSERGDYGNALLYAKRLKPYSLSLHNISFKKKEPRSVIDAYFSYENKLIRVISTHFGLAFSERSNQLSELLTIINTNINKSPDLTILMGDFNEWFFYGKIHRKLKKIFPHHKRIATFPSFFPLLCLDRIWITPEHYSVSIQKSTAKEAIIASDHLPLIAEIED